MAETSLAPDMEVPPGASFNEAKKHTPNTWFHILDALRGGAALYVVCNHASTLLMLSFRQVSELNVSLAVQALSLLSYVFAYGAQAVVFFFVLSGFCIHYRQAQKLHDAAQTGKSFTFQTTPYLARRMRRIVPPYYFALAFTAGADAWIRHINPAFAHPATGNVFADMILVQHNDRQTLFGNLLFLQWLRCPTWGNDTPLWSLAYEFFLYLLYPVFWQLRLRAGAGGSLLLVLAVSVASIVSLSLFPHTPVWILPVLACWFCWVMGAWAAEIYVKDGFHDRTLVPGMLTLSLGAVWLALAHSQTFPVNATLGALVCVSLMLSVLKHFGTGERSIHQQRALAALAATGKFSYSLYLTHVPVLAVLWALWAENFGAVPMNPLLFLGGVACALGVGWLAFWLVEQRFTNHP